MIKLETKHLVGYLPYGLKILGHNEYFTLSDIDSRKTLTPSDTVELQYKPILRPLADLKLDIFSEQFFEDQSEWIGNDGTPLAKVNDFLTQSNVLDVCFPYGIWELFFRHHFDIFGLIDAGLALNKNNYEK